ncbi:endonuclease MutS2 [Bacillus solimangrovi]|uniref:Endonuclease MutS2 n=2 Tax=Bacillus solimangrovi TaxID=1305675 RepID=A0A1E5LCX7_9BACI|nr:endonuclease MutS2 [Bacillus solimangrovi]
MRVLEYNKVKEQLQKHAASSLGRGLAIDLKPSFDFYEVKENQNKTDEAAKVLRLKGTFPLGGIFEIRPSIKRAEIGGMLSSKELVEVSSTIYASRQAKQYVLSLVDEDIDIPILEQYVEQLQMLNDLENKINNCIDDNGAVMDGASDRLRSIRTKLRTTESRVREKLESITRSSSTQKMLSDNIITIRNDRYVIPVKQEYRSSFGGMVHDQSSSGATLFIEPQSVVELNNKLQEAKVQEKQEIEKILLELSGFVAEDAYGLRENVEILAQIDFMFTKAKLGRTMKASKPEMNNEGYVDLKKARHPLISEDEIVANDITLGKEYTSIVITGPNTGGKTVTLKTLGLLTLMAQSGLQIPALDGSKMTVFQAVYADIGDEQSIEQSLSTFSSHMTNIVEILKKVDHESLVLFDELGAGTDPQEGAALAIAILDEVYHKGARVIATTHYPELKAYGYNREGVLNASVEFDVESLRPTYRLLLGVPGRSNAFEISKRLGLQSDVIEKAKSHMSAESNKVENMIASLEESRKRSELEMEESVRLRKESESLQRDLEAKLEEFQLERDRMYDKAQEEAKQAIKKAKAEADVIIKSLRKMQQEKQVEVREHELIDARKQLEEATPELKKSKKMVKKKAIQSKEMLPGDEVKVLTFDQKGYIISKVSNKEYEVQIGIMKMKVKKDDLQLIGSPKKVEKKPLAAVKGKQYHVKPELDIRGERYEDALYRLEKYVDDALLAGYPSITIIHGKGTGVLRKGVNDYLKNHRSVKAVRLGGMSEGGSGATVAELK